MWCLGLPRLQLADGVIRSHGNTTSCGFQHTFPLIVADLCRRRYAIRMGAQIRKVAGPSLLWVDQGCFSRP